MTPRGLTYAPSHHSWSSTSSLPPWDGDGGSSTTPDSISSSSSYFDPFSDHPRTSQHHHHVKASWKEQEDEIDEWKWKCGQLEHTVSRLMRQVEHLRKERDDLMLESIATGTANLVFGIDDENSVSETPLPLSLSFFRD
jgi:hypothetical protein